MFYFVVISVHADGPVLLPLLDNYVKRSAHSQAPIL